jgi:hypothetical protein
MTQIIVEALEITKQRGIINKGWGGLGNCKFSFNYKALYVSYISNARKYIFILQLFHNSDVAILTNPWISFFFCYKKNNKKNLIVGWNCHVSIVG